MKKIIPIFILLLSCSTAPTTKEKDEFLSKFIPEMEKHRKCFYEEIDSLQNDLLSSIKDTVDRKMYKDKTRYFRRANVRFIHGVDHIAYQIMIVVDSIPEEYTSAVDTFNPSYSNNFKEDKKSLAFLKNGLNDRIKNKIKYWEEIITDSLPVKVNLSEFWANNYPRIDNMGDFQIARYKLNYKSDSIVCTILKYFKAQYLRKRVDIK